ncbi:MAG: thioredoxin family protein [Chloroflexi bacterium]|nr:thioredoxin family protein [Chloroflexota bacterium]
MAKPVVDGIERELNEKTPLWRINVREASGAALAGRFGVRGVPTLVVWRDGEVLRQVGRINKGAVLIALKP